MGRASRVSPTAPGRMTRIWGAAVGSGGSVSTEIGPGSPTSLDRGGMARFFHVAIAIASMNRSTEAIADPLYSALFRSDIKRSTCPDQNPSNVNALFGATGDNCSDDIPRLEAFDLLCS